MEYVIIWIAFCFVVAHFGSSRTIVYFNSFLASFFLSPIVGLIIVLMSRRNDDPTLVESKQTEMINASLAFIEKDNFAKAEYWANKALEFNSNKPEKAFYALACCYSKQNMPDKAFEYIRKSINSGFKNFEKIDQSKFLINLNNYQPFIDFKENDYKLPNKSSATNFDNIDALSKLGQLYKDNLITKEEFEEQKKKYL